MRISELSARTEVSIPTLKYYLREGLLPPGEPTSATAAEYGDAHLERVRLVRALIESGGLSVAGVRRIVETLDASPPTRHELLGVAAYALSTEREQQVPDESRRMVDDLLEALGWQVSAGSPVRRELAVALTAAWAAGVDPGVDGLHAYARAMHDVAEVDVRSVPRDSMAEAVRVVVVWTVLLDPVLVALRRLAQEDVSSRQA